MFASVTFCKAQYTTFQCGPNLTPAFNYVYLGSLYYAPDNAGNSQKLQVDIIGAGWGNPDKGTSTFYIANRGGLSVNQVTQGGYAFSAANLKVFQNGATTNFYLNINSSADYYSFAVKSFIFGNATTTQQVTITTQTAIPAGTDITSSVIVNPVFITDQSGNIGINTLSPNPVYKLSVNGKIRAKEIRVETGWADYVFDEKYKLLPLADVKAYIDKNHHLPEIPSEKEIVENGLNLGEMNILLLKKVEELTLYLIEQKAELNEQRVMNAKQVKRIELLERKMERKKK